jgi:hypothetical protein
LNLSNNKLTDSDISSLFKAIADVRSLSKLILRKNLQICDDDDLKALSDALVSNTSLRELDLAGQGSHGTCPEGVMLSTVPVMGQGDRPIGKMILQAFSAGLSDTALSVVNVMGNRTGKETLEMIARTIPNLISLCGIADDTTEVDFNGLNMNADEVAILASELKQNKGALSVVNVLRNDISTKQREELINIMETKDHLTSLCGIRPDQEEANFSFQELRACDAILITNDILKNGRLLHLNISSTAAMDIHSGTSDRTGRQERCITYDTAGIITLVGAVRDHQALVSLQCSGNHIGGWDGESGVHALAGMLKINRTLIDLNIARNNLDAECARILGPAISDSTSLSSLNLANNLLCNVDDEGHGTYDASGTIPLLCL